jgi:predicted CoA-binding protein
MHAENLAKLLNKVKTIALVGASQKTHRPSYEVMAFLQDRGYKIYPVNPKLAGQTILGQKVYAQLNELPERVDMVEIFRNSEAAGETSQEVIALPISKRPNIVWMQIGVINEVAAKQLKLQGIQVIMDECPKMILGG